MFYPLPKLSEVVAKDELRPQMCHAYMTKKYIFASDAHVLVRLNTKAHFTAETIELIPSQGVFLDVYTLRALQKNNIDSVGVVHLGFAHLIEIIYHSGEHVFYPWKTVADVGQTYPKCDSIIHEVCDPDSRVEVDQLSFKAQLMLKLQRGLGDSDGINCYFNGLSRGIYVLPMDSGLVAEGRIGILMPIENPVGEKAHH